MIHPSGEQFELTHGDRRAVVVEVGGGLRSFAVGDWEVLDGYGPDERIADGRGQILIPWPNRLRDGRYEWGGETWQLPLTEPPKGNAIHGLTRWSAWRAVVRETARVVLAHRLHPQAGWPFTLDLELEYALDDDGLTVHTRATNAGEQPCPFGAGAHPYLTVGTERIDEAVLEAPGGVRLLADERQIPTGGREPVDGTPYDFRTPRALGDMQLDDAFTQLARDDDGRARVHLRSPHGAREATLWMDESFEHLMLFTGDSLPEPVRSRRSLGVEPMTCAPNALQSGEGLISLAPGERFSGAWGIVARAN